MVGAYGQVTVYTVQTPVPGGEAADIQTRGMQFALADIKVCADAPGSDFTGFDWHLLDVDDRSFGFFNTQVGARPPNFNKIGSVPIGHCVRGYLTFEVPKGTRLRYITYDAENSGSEPLVWRIA